MTTSHQPAGDPALDPPREQVTVHVALTRDPIDIAAAHDDVVHPQAGAVGLFSGVVRNHHDGAAVSELVYEAWEQRAPTRLRAVVDQVAARHPGVRAVHVTHRIGRLAVGEVSIVCAASAPHRREALAAATDLIDLVKEQVPVWKQERHVDGRVTWPGSEDRPPSSHSPPAPPTP